MTDFRALCAELLRGLDENRHPEVRYPGHLRLVMAAARAALAEPEPEGPPVWTEGICGDGAALLRDGVMIPIEEVVRELNRGAQARAVLSRWGTPNLAETRSSLGDAPQSVPVSERLPGPEDCDGAGRCWWFHDEDNALCSHWLPAHALPLPDTNDHSN